MSVNGEEDEGLPEVNHRLQDGNKEVENGVGDEKQVTIDEDDLIVNGSSEDVKRGHMGPVNGPSALQMLQQQPQNGVVCWQRFLHVRTLKVLLVENDDCTRHIVTALLRNCSYEVIEAANGLQAWKILEDTTNHIDIVLTEVAMPCLNGIGLLCKIMSHMTRKNVPVIMMSSLDSMGLVFACLSKGAVDFLVKPVRKNELKNLWQHVWRRCHSSSGSGSESGTQTQKSVKSKGVENSDNNTGSNDGSYNGSIGLDVGDGSEDGSGAQSSWTKQAVEVDSSRPASPLDRVAECPDSTCAQVIHSNAEASGNKCVPTTAVKECRENGDRLDKNPTGKDMGIEVPRKVDLLVECQTEIPVRTAGADQYSLHNIGPSNQHEQVDNRHLDLNTESPSYRLEAEATNLTGIITKTNKLQKESTDFDAPNGPTKILDHNDKTINDVQEPPSFELGLKRFRVEDSGLEVREERNVLRRSNSSAFSRYNTSSSTVNKTPGANVKNASALDNCLEITRKGEVRDVRSQSIDDPPNQCSNVGSNNIDVGSITNNAFIKPAFLRNGSAGSSTLKSSQPFHPPENEILANKADNVAAKTLLDQPIGASGNFQQQPLEHGDPSLKKIAAAAPHCQSPNVLPDQANVDYYSVNRSGSGSNHGSNEPNSRSSPGVNTGGANGESENGIAGKSGSGSARGSADASATGTVNRIDLNKSAHRVAALTKFRQKKKDRCFQKKVRYQNRKRLAEQRPRVRGQFVRQSGNENSSSGADKAS